MTFGKRFSRHNNRDPVVVARTCVRCYGTGHVRERGTRLICKACTGSGRVAERAGHEAAAQSL
jgi:DnaJ-class molecular chaperone